MNLPWLIVSLLSVVLAGLFCFFFGRKGYQAIKERFDPLSYFPYELFKDSRGPYFAFARVFEVLYLGSLLILPLTAFILRSHYLDTSFSSFAIGILSVQSLSVLALLFLSLVPLKEYRTHLFLYLFHGGTSSLALSMEGLLIHTIGKNDGKEILGWVFAGLLFFFALLSVLLWFNPKLRRWAEMKRVALPDGTFAYERPRPFVLAWSEWQSIAIQGLGALIATLGYFFIVG